MLTHLQCSRARKTVFAPEVNQVLPALLGSRSRRAPWLRKLIDSSAGMQGYTGTMMTARAQSDVASPRILCITAEFLSIAVRALSPISKYIQMTRRMMPAARKDSKAPVSLVEAPATETETHPPAAAMAMIRTKFLRAFSSWRMSVTLSHGPLMAQKRQYTELIPKVMSGAIHARSQAVFILAHTLMIADCSSGVIMQESQPQS
mmetsp:Transcript_95745/g.259923  ORF Transcript_95745/g.259923 Transcript_95745/m.259923 type:complete len:204 (+) Transcript_95745:1389-2000(+)